MDKLNGEERKSHGWSTAVDIQAISFRLTLDTAMEFLLSKSYDSQTSAIQKEDCQPSDDTFLYGFDRCIWYFTERPRFERLYWAIYNWNFGSVPTLWTSSWTGMLTLRQQEEKAHCTEEVSPQYIFLKALASTIKDPIRLRDEFPNVLLARRDTTASLLSWTILLLARHPHIFVRLRSDILDQFGTYGQPRTIDFMSLKLYRYL